MQQDKGLKRNTIDKYYTKKSVVDICLELFKKYINITDNDIIIEPSAGNGAFINSIKNLCNNYLFYDIEPEHTEIIKQDYLLFNPNTIQKYKNIHIIGNPPFGRQSTFAIKFIKKSCEFSNTISFILPKSFKKDSIKKHFPLNFHLIAEIDLPSHSFIVGEIEHDVPCIFQIWQKNNIQRIPPQILHPTNYTFVKKNQNPDISFRRVGVNAGNVSNSITDKSEQSHYFIKISQKKIDQTLIDKFNSINFQTSSHTVGPKSISKQELIKEFNKIIL